MGGEKTENSGIDLKDIDPADFGFSSMSNPYTELYRLEDVAVEEFYAAGTVIAFHHYVSEQTSSESGFEEKIEEALEGIKRFRDKEVISSDLEFLYDPEYIENLEMEAEHRNMSKQIAEYDEDDPTSRRDMREMEKKFISHLLGEEYDPDRSQDSDTFL